MLKIEFLFLSLCKINSIKYLGFLFNFREGALFGFYKLPKSKSFLIQKIEIENWNNYNRQNEPNTAFFLPA